MSEASLIQALRCGLASARRLEDGSKLDILSMQYTYVEDTMPEDDPNPDMAEELVMSIEMARRLRMQLTHLLDIYDTDFTPPTV